MISTLYFEDFSGSSIDELRFFQLLRRMVQVYVEVDSKFSWNSQIYVSVLSAFDKGYISKSYFKQLSKELNKDMEYRSFALYQSFDSLRNLLIPNKEVIYEE